MERNEETKSVFIIGSMSCFSRATFIINALQPLSYIPRVFACVRACVRTCAHGNVHYRDLLLADRAHPFPSSKESEREVKIIGAAHMKRRNAVY